MRDAPTVAGLLATAAALALASLGAGCDWLRGDERAAVVDDPLSAAPPLAARGDEARGRALVARFECNRCHEGTGLPPPPPDKHCVKCHADIEAGVFDAPGPLLAKWREEIVDLRVVPSLTAVGARLRRGWLEAFLLEPCDVRPGLRATMPRLAIAPAEARDIATFLAPEDEAPVTLRGDAARGARLYLEKRCAACHRLGAPDAEATPGRPVASHALALAPDLRHVRDRFRRDRLVSWLRDPSGLKPDTAMAPTHLSGPEAEDVAAFLVATPLPASPRRVIAVRLPVLTRPVGFDEVEARVLRKTCWHCHAEPDFAFGDGGPGNSGGFGFRARGVQLASHEGVFAGYYDDQGERQSLFAPTADGTPRLLASLLARQEEEAGVVPGAVRGMPLGLPSLSAEDVQLVESWIAQGRPR